MHKIYEYLCDELKDLEKKAESGQELSMAELEYLNKLTETKKNLLKIEMLEEDSEYSNAMDGGSYAGSYARSGRGGSYRGSYARGRGRGARRDSMGRYTSGRRYSRDEAKDEVMRHLEKAMNGASGEQRKIIQDALEELKNM